MTFLNNSSRRKILVIVALLSTWHFPIVAATTAEGVQQPEQQHQQQQQQYALPRILQLPGDGIDMDINQGKCVRTTTNVTCDIQGKLEYKPQEDESLLSTTFHASMDCDFATPLPEEQEPPEFPDIVRQSAESCTCSVVVTNPDASLLPFHCDCTVCAQGFGRAPLTLSCRRDDVNNNQRFLIGTCSYLDCNLACNGTCSVPECLADVNPACPICDDAPGRIQAAQKWELTAAPTTTRSSSRRITTTTTTRERLVLVVVLPIVVLIDIWGSWFLNIV